MGGIKKYPNELRIFVNADEKSGSYRKIYEKDVDYDSLFAVCNSGNRTGTRTFTNTSVVCLGKRQVPKAKHFSF